uniref:UBA domain-containing protein n=2 Tax=Schistocephalus solidus TaxID=70667 RepID=A0A0X3P2U7_SCHSO
MRKDTSSVIESSFSKQSARAHSKGEDGYIHSMPKATTEQLNLAKLLTKTTDESDVENRVQQVQDTTACTVDEAVSALHDCDNDVHRAIEYILDNKKDVDDWHVTSKKRSKAKRTEQAKSESILTQDSTKDGSQSHASTDDQHERTSGDSQGKKTAKPSSTKRRSGKPNSSNENEGISMSTLKEERAATPTCLKEFASDKLSTEKCGDWEVECGEWKGEAIEVVNSNSDFPVNIHEDSELLKLVTTEPEEIQEKIPVEAPKPEKPVEVLRPPTPQPQAKAAESSKSVVSARSLLFTKYASSALPRPSTIPNVPVFFAPGAHAATTSRLNHPSAYNFAQDSPTSRPNVDILDGSSKPKNERRHEKKGKTKSANFEHSVEEVQPKSPTQCAFPSSTDSFLPNVPGTQPVQALHSERPFSPKMQETAVLKDTYAQLQERDSPQNVGSMTSFEPANTFSNYLLDELSQNINKVNLETHSNKADAFTQSLSSNQPDVSYHPVQSLKTPVSQPQLGKATQNIQTTSNQLQMSSGQCHPQMHPNVNPGMPQLISQFHAAFPMFNLHGGSGAAPQLLDLDQIQALQQQRLLFDMQQHSSQQPPTATEPSIPNTCSDVLSSSKSTPPMGHVTAPSASLRPDLLASTLSHHQMLGPTAAAAPFLPYPGFLVMNGYPNAFLNQQQASQPSVTQSQNPGHGGSPLTQHQPAQQYVKGMNSTSNYQGYQGMRQSNFDDLGDISYQNIAKQVGYKHGGNQQTVYASQPGQPAADLSMSGKLQQAGACPTNMTGSQNQSQQQQQQPHTAQYPHSGGQFTPFYTQHYLTAMAALIAQHGSVGNTSGCGGVAGNTPMQGANMGSGLHGSPPMVMGSAGSVMHHQRPGPPQH